MSDSPPAAASPAGAGPADPGPGPGMRRPPVVTWALLAVSLATGWHIARTAAGLLLNNYPFMTSDSFDWILEGLFLARAITGDRPERPLPAGRNPVFVVVMTLDALLGQRGLVFALVTATAVFFIGWLLVAHLGRFRHPAGAAAAFLVITFLAQVNNLHPYILADLSCTALSVGAFLAVLRATQATAGQWRWAAGAAVLTALAGLTQEYGILTPAVAAAVAGITALRRGRRDAAGLGVGLLITAAIAIVAGYALWYGLLPHEGRRNPWGYLGPAPSLVRFYLEVWAYVMLPLVPLVAVIRRADLRRAGADAMTMAAGGSVLAFVGLCLIYNWPSTRYTAFFWPYLVLALFRTIGSGPEAAAPRRAVVAAYAAGALVLIQTLLVTPAVPELPRFRSLALDPGRSWLVQFVRAEPVDRMELSARCGSRSTLCPEALSLRPATPFQKRIMAYYEWLVLGR
jgi:hypothetical protein